MTEYFRYVELIKGGAHNRGDVIQLPDGKWNHDLDYYGKEIVDGFHSAFMQTVDYLNHRDPNGGKSGYTGEVFNRCFFWDFDNTDVVLVRNEAIELVERLLAYNPNNISIYYSGNKGFHILYYSPELTGFMSPTFNQTVKNFCSDVAKGLSSFDRKIYDKTRIFRTPNSKHSVTGLYKIPLSYDELKGLSVDEIKSLAKTQRKFVYKYDDTVDPDLIEHIKHSDSETTPEKAGGVFTGSEILDGMRYGFPTGERNNGLASIAGLLHSRGFDLSVVEPLVMAVNYNSPNPLPDNEVERICRSIDRYPVNHEYIQPTCDAITTIQQAGESWCERMRTSGFFSLGDRFPHVNDRMRTCIPGDVVGIVADSGVGKAQPYSADILTPTGFRKMGDLTVGDYVIGRNGLPTKITNIFEQGEKEVYDFILSDGDKTQCVEDHLWYVRDRRNHFKEKVLKTSEMMDDLYCINGEKRFSIPYVSPVVFERRGELKVHPYVVGCLLGDGCINGSITLHNSEMDVINKFSSLLPDSCCLKTSIKKGTKNNYYSRVVKKTHVFVDNINKDCNKNEVYKHITDYFGFRIASHEKFIPEDYLFSSIEDRVELLRGLLDTDGYVTRNNSSIIEYSTASTKMAEQIKFLVQSLGGRCTITEREITYVYKGERKKAKNNFRVIITMISDIVPVSSEKHLKRYSPKCQRNHRYVSKIIVSGKEKSRCIVVDSPDHLYVTDNFIVTHNSSIGLEFGNSEAKTRSTDGDMKYSLFGSLEMSKEGVFFRAATIEAVEFTDQNFRVPSTEVADNLLRAEELKQRVYQQWKHLLILDKGGLSLDQIAEYFLLAQDVYEGRITNLVIDYAQNMDKAENIELAMAMARKVKAVAKELKTILFILFQCNKTIPDSYTRIEKNHLEGAGAWRQACDYLMSFWKSRDNKNRLHGEFIKDRWGESEYLFDLVREGLKYHSEDHLPERNQYGL